MERKKVASNNNRTNLGPVKKGVYYSENKEVYINTCGFKGDACILLYFRDTCANKLANTNLPLYNGQSPISSVIDEPVY